MFRQSSFVTEPEQITSSASGSTFGRSLPPVLADTLFLLGSIACFVIFAAILRALLLYANQELAAQIPAASLFGAFVTGARFDLLVGCALTLPLVFALLLPHGLGSRRIAIGWLVITGAFTLFAGVTELEFYREFHTRLNSIAFHYLQEDVATVTSMIWNGYPVPGYLLLWLLLSISYVFALRWVDGLTGKNVYTRYRAIVRLPVFIVVLLLVVLGARGTLRSGPPLRWGDAFTSPHLFANHLALNGSYTLVKAATDSGKSQGDRWLKSMPADTARTITRQMLLVAGDELLEPDTYPLLRLHTPTNRLPRPPKNIVLIMMESFSGEFTGALGNDHDITPYFDQLAQQGLLFDRFFSNGTHTHQGMFATLACFPNLPGHEYLMQQPEGQHQFSGLPVLLKNKGFNDLYVYNGHFAWDNQAGFFRNQGMTRFIGRDDFVDPVFIDSTWGVSDQDMFARALEELNRMPADRPFYAVLQTLSNHTPYALPEQLPVPPVTGFGKLDDHLTAQRYADWALGQFFAAARSAPWFGETAFILVGDHGFPMGRQLSGIDLLRFRVPLLIMGPGIRETYGALNHTASTQTDVVPTALGLLGQPFVHQCWGRNLLSLPEGDPGLGVIKPSGSDQTVALIRGEQILVKPPAREAELGNYGLSPGEYYQHETDAQLTADYENQLGAFIQSALQGLRDNRLGVPEP